MNFSSRLDAKNLSSLPGGNVPVQSNPHKPRCPTNEPTYILSQIDANHVIQLFNSRGLILHPELSSDINFPIYFILRSTFSRLLTEHSSLKLSEDLEKILRAEDAPVTIMSNGSLLVKAGSISHCYILLSSPSLNGVSHLHPIRKM